MTRRRSGVVLMVALFALLALAFLSTGLLFVSGQAAAIAHTRADATRARLAAEAGAAAALAAWHSSTLVGLPTLGLRTLPAAAGSLPAGARHEAEAARLAGDLFLVQARGWTGAGGRATAQARVGVLVRALDPFAIARSFPAALAASGPVHVGASGRIDGLADGPPEPWPAASCAFPPGTPSPDEPRPGLLVADPARLRIHPDATVNGWPPVASDPTLAGKPPTGLGPLPRSRLPDLADRVESGAVRLGPAALDGRCDPAAPGNWGDPLDPEGPCADYFPLIYAPGDLHVTGGAGQGVLVVEGTLTFGPHARFFGPVAAAGAVRLQRGAAIHGAVLREGAGADPSAIDGSVAFNACALTRALAGSPALNQPFRPGRRWWIPLY